MSCDRCGNTPLLKIYLNNPDAEYRLKTEQSKSNEVENLSKKCLMIMVI